MVTWQKFATAPTQTGIRARLCLKATRPRMCWRTFVARGALVPAVKPAEQARVWLGAPNSIKGPTEAVFQRQSGSNLLIVGQSEERTLTLLAVALVALAAQYPPGSARFVVLDSTPPGLPQREFLERVIQAVPHEVKQVNNSNLAETMTALAEELKTSDR